MTNGLFVTGSSGFIGSRFLETLDHSGYSDVYCFCRDRNRLPKSLKADSKFQIIQGDIYDCEKYAPFLAASETVVHLAAVTGKAPSEDYFKINAAGTKFFVDQCEQAGVANFLHVSTIAVKYPDKSGYDYARSKELGEEAIRGSRLNYSIVRPTIVIGKDGPTLASLSKLVKMPVTPIFGDGQTRVQPIYLDDLVECLLTVLNRRLFSNETYEIGGPEILTFGDFLKRIHFAYYHKEPRLVHIPLKPLTRLLARLEKRFYAALPITAGQLSAFGNDGTIEQNKLFDRQASRMKNVQEMLGLVVNEP